MKIRTPLSSVVLIAMLLAACTPAPAPASPPAETAASSSSVPVTSAQGQWQKFSENTKGFVFQMPSAWRVIASQNTGRDVIDSASGKQVATLYCTPLDDMYRKDTGMSFVTKSRKFTAAGKLYIVSLLNFGEGKAYNLKIWEDAYTESENTCTLMSSTVSAVPENVWLTLFQTLSVNGDSGTETYRNTDAGYSIQVPALWGTREDSYAPTGVNKVGGLGTTFVTVKAEPIAFVTVSPSCPDLSSYTPGPNMTIDGRTFVTASHSSGAAGSKGEYVYYVSKKDSTHCTVIVTAYYHTTGDAYDEPERSRIKAEIAETQKTLETFARSFKTL